MINPITFKASVEYNKIAAQKESANPLCEKVDMNGVNALSNYNQVLLRPKYDKDAIEVLNKARDMNNLAPKKLEIPHSFNIDEVNGERVYKKDGTLAYIREYENEIIREYYPQNTKIEKVIERNKKTGQIIAKIEPQEGRGIKLTVFDDKINNKYTMFQLEEDGLISAITEFSGKGQSFRTLFRNPDTTMPVRYLEARDNDDGEFAVLDSRFDNSGRVLEIKKMTDAKQVKIEYEGDKKNISVKGT